jgi:REP element-mobilizing transposase RayT
MSELPFGFHITIRAYGTWLHGKDRGSVDRFHNRFGTPRLPRNKQWEKHNRKLLSQRPVKLESRQRRLIEKAVREICKTRKWKFWATNVRTNHVHTVVSALCKPERIRSALKASATKKLREGGCWRSNKSPWVEKGSIKWLWTERDLINAIVYVEYDQGEPLP